MKKIVAILVVFLISFSVFSQKEKESVLSDSLVKNSYIMNGEMKSDIDTISNGVKEIGNTIVKDYKDLGTDGFISKYKYFIIIVLLFGFLTFLWARNRKI